MKLFTLLVYFAQLAICGAKVELEGPTFTLIPAPVTYFSNSLGTTVSCLSKGNPPITTTWLTANGDPVLTIPGLREILPNNSLYFGSFKPEEYSASTHNGQYRCAITNPVGTLLSPVFSVRAVVDHNFEVHISDSGTEDGDVVEGNPVILHCDVTPSFYKEFTRIVFWKSVDQFGYETEIQSDGIRYQITRKGALVVFNARYQQLFVCVAQNVLNNKIQSSSPFLVKTKAGLTGLPPKSSRRWEQIITAESRKPVDLLCPAVGNPPPNFVWFKYQPGIGGNGENVPVVIVSGNGVEMRGPLLSFTHVDISQNGTYRCEVTNSIGSFVLDIALIVIPSPVVTVEPRRKSLRLGQSLELGCKISPLSPHPSHPPEANMDLVWMRNGKTLVSDSRIKVSGSKVLIFNAAMDDQGMYQCFVSQGQQTIQAFAEVVFEASKPELVNTFIAQSLQPGPAISMKCSAVGNPLPEIHWFVDSQELLPSPSDPLQARFWQMSDRYSVGSYKQFATEIVSHINISQVRIEDSSDYKCLAVNLVGSVSHSARLNIYGPLFIRDMPSLTLISGATVLIPCMYGGYPVDQIIWRKNSKDLVSTLPGQSRPQKNGRFSVLQNGTLRIEQINTASDKGQYTCVISNRKGEIASGTVDVNVMRPPVISAFNFDENLVEGQRASITCNVMSGDLPIEIVWLKDFQVIPPFLNITKERVKFLSYLIFEELRSDHSGVYTCSATNAAATANYSASLVVKVPPKWIQEPQDARMILKTDHAVPCLADGIPRPVVKWYRVESGGVMKSELVADRKFELIQDGTLRIRNVDAGDAGVYVCEAGNGVGNGLTKSIRVHVNIPAKVSAPMTSIVVAEGVGAFLKCHIRGDRPIDVVWKKNAGLLEPSARIGIQTLLDANSSVLSAELRIEQAERSDSGLYVCSGSNLYGRDEDEINLEVKARPSPPEDFMVEEIGSRFIRLRWSLGVTSASSVPVTYFLLQYKKSSFPSWTSAARSDDILNTTVQSPATHAVLENLHPVTHYDIRIFASNEIGHSLPTEPLAVLTLPEAPSGPPFNISALPINPKTVVVRWEPPHASVQHGTILGYHVLLTLQLHTAAGNYESSGSNNNNNTTVLVDEKWAHQTQVQGLKPNSQYKIAVRAYNSAGMGPESPPVSVHTPEGAPDAPPTNMRCEGLSPKSLQVQWDPPPPPSTNGQIQGYKVLYQPTSDEKIGDKLEVKKTSNRETTLHGLQSYTNYSIRSLAFTSGGEGVLSNPVFCMTEEDVPEEVADVKAVIMASNTALLSWLPPLLPNGRVTKYTVLWKAEDAEAREKIVTPTDEEQLYLEIRRLKENQRYNFQVTASTSAGPGKSSRIETLVVSGKAGARIASFPVIRNVLLEQTVTLPCRVVGQPAPKVTWLKNGRVETTHHIMRNNSLFINRVKDQEEGIYTCRAENVHGMDEIQHRVVISRPPSKVPLFLGYVTSNSVQLHWEPPQKSDPPVIGFILEYQDEGGIEWKSRRFGQRVSSVTLEHLRCGATYKFRMAAENAVGVGDSSDQLITKTNGNPPESPKLTDVLDGNGTMIRIDLSRWADGGCPLTNFHIEYKIRDSTNWQRIYRKDNLTKVYTFATILKTKYEIRISIENDAGSVMKTFLVESIPEFFSNYGKVLERTDEQSGGQSHQMFLADPHVIVPIVSAIICTGAVAVCILIVYKRRAQTKDEWKYAQSASQQTWLSPEETGAPKPEQGNKYSDRGGEPKMSVYATLNSTKPIPMTIRDSTVRFQTFAQHENYDAPIIVPMNYNKKTRRKSNSSPPEVSCMSSRKDNYAATPLAVLDPRSFQVPPPAIPSHINHHHFHTPDNNSDSDENTDSLYANNYAKPYHHISRINDTLDISGLSSLKKKNKALRPRGSREYLD